MGRVEFSMPADGVTGTNAELHATGTQIGLKCAQVNKEFVLCKNKDANPSACLAQGDAVTACVTNLLKQMGSSCGDSLGSYSACLDKNSLEFRKCRTQQAEFEACANQQ